MNATTTPAQLAATLPAPDTRPLGSILRAALGLYLTVTFIRLLPYATALYTAQGMLPDPHLNPTAAALPEVITTLIWAWATPVGAQCLLVVGALAGLALALEYRPRLAAVILWAVQALLWHRNVLTLNPTLPINGFLLLASLALPRGRRFGTPIPADLARVLWIVAAVAYTTSGLSKLTAPSWRSGEALGFILSGPLARDVPWVAPLLQAPIPLKVLTLGTLALEIGFGFMALSRRLRPWALLAMTGLHLGILSTIAFAELTLGMLPLHLALVADAGGLRWPGAAWRRARSRPRPAVPGATATLASGPDSRAQPPRGRPSTTVPTPDRA